MVLPDRFPTKQGLKLNYKCKIGDWNYSSQTDFQQNKDWNMMLFKLALLNLMTPRPISNKTRIETWRIGAVISWLRFSQTDFQQNKDWNPELIVNYNPVKNSQTDFQQNKDWNTVKLTDW